MATLKINTSSFYHQYFVLLRRVWGMADISRPRSLCPYFQTIFWMSLVTFVFSPLLAYGWLTIWIGRIVYKQLVKCESLISISNYLLGERLDRASERMTVSPALNMFVWGLSSVAIVLSVLVAYSFFTDGIWYLIDVIVNIPAFVFRAVLDVGYAVFRICGLIGCGLVWLWGLAVSSEVHYFVVYWLGVGVVLSACGAVMLLLGKHVGKPLWGIFVFRFNGFFESRPVAIKREKEMTVDRVGRNILIEKFLDVWDDVILEWICGFCAFVKGIFISRRGDDGEIIMSPCCMVWESLVAIKNGVCPMISYSDYEIVGAELRAIVDREREGQLKYDVIFAIRVLLSEKFRCLHLEGKVVGKEEAKGILREAGFRPDVDFCYCYDEAVGVSNWNGDPELTTV